jgi:hypothetical protein
LAVVAGCSGVSQAGANSTNSTHPAKTSSTTAKRPGGHTSTASAEPGGKRTPIPNTGSYKVSTPPGTSKGYVGAARDVNLSTCHSSKTTTTFAGTVTNPTGTSQSYRIYVAVTLEGSTLGLDEVDVKTLAATATSRWKGSLSGGAHGATCVLRVERTAHS